MYKHESRYNFSNEMLSDPLWSVQAYDNIGDNMVQHVEVCLKFKGCNMNLARVDPPVCYFKEKLTVDILQFHFNNRILLAFSFGVK